MNSAYIREFGIPLVRNRRGNHDREDDVARLDHSLSHDQSQRRVSRSLGRQEGLRIQNHDRTNCCPNEMSSDRGGCMKTIPKTYLFFLLPV